MNPAASRIFINEHGLVQGIPLSTSTLSDILREKDKWLAIDISTGGARRKNRGMLFPVLEQHLVEWVDRANEEHVVISEDVLRTATESLMPILVGQISNLEEDYADFI